MQLSDGDMESVIPAETDEMTDERKRLPDLQL